MSSQTPEVIVGKPATLSDLADRFDARFNNVDERLNTLDKRDERLENKLDELAAKIGQPGHDNGISGQIDTVVQSLPLPGKIKQWAPTIAAIIAAVVATLQTVHH